MEDWQQKLKMQSDAAMIRAMGLQAANTSAELVAHGAPALPYNEGHFVEIAVEIEEMAQEICNR